MNDAAADGRRDSVATRRVLIVGGYGTFGGRLAQLLAEETRLTLIVAGRTRTKAESFCAALSASATLLPIAFDRDGDVERQLQQIAPDIVVDATGPFQLYSGDGYRVVRAAIALGIHYLDLADDTAFVAGIAQFDDAARARQIFVLSAVSTCPVLTAAVARRLSTDLAQVESITAGIAPSPHANVGINVIRALASYAGKPVTLWRDSRRATGHALIDAVWFTIAPPGRLPLGRRRFSLVDVPDLQLLPQLWPGLRAVWIGAGPVPAVLHRAFSMLAWIARLRILPSLSPLAGLMDRVVKSFRWGERRGGMFVAVRGRTSNGVSVERSWHLLAEADDGPFIPAMAAAAIIRKCLAGHAPEPGARAAMNDLELADYEALFARRQITTGTRQAPRSDERVPLYRQILGDAYVSMPQPLQAMHDLNGEMVVEGVAQVERGTSLLSRLIGWIMGFPPAGDDVPVRVTFQERDGREYWLRNFAGHEFKSVQEAGQGRNAWLLCERFGPLTIAMALVVADGRMQLVIRRWTVFGIPFPRVLAPESNAYEFVRDGRFHFNVEIVHFFTGPIVTYRGWLVPRQYGEPCPEIPG
jgi:Domain of unknown function (DUF4166)/Saccharopine dehydrogenase NADP binding domain